VARLGSSGRSATARTTGCQAGDPELGRWALEAWQRESGGLIILIVYFDQLRRRRR